MRFLRNLVVGLIGLVVILAAAAFLLPRHQIVERQIAIAAPPEAIFPLVNSLQRGEDWSPWLVHDPETVIEYSGPEAGVGAAMSWSSENPQVGSGSQEITESVENQLVRTALDFGDMGQAEAWFQLREEADGTLLTWGLDADMGNNPMGRWMGLMMDRWVGADYEVGLGNIRDLAEASDG